MPDELISIIIGNMQTQQQLSQSQLDNFQEFPQDQQQEATLINTKPLETKYTVFVITLIILLVTAVILFTLYIAYSLQETPKVHIEYLQEAYLPSLKQTQKPRMVEAMRSPLLQVVSTQVKILKSSAQSLVDVQSTNSAHRGYQHIMRNLQSQNCHMVLDKYGSKRISDNSALTFQQYLRAVDFLQLTTYPIGDIYNNDYILLSNKDRDHFQKQYDINPFITETSICAVMSLTNEGLQSGTYYYALKSLLHQEYNHFRVVVINSPEMHMLKDISKLLSLYPLVNVTLIDKMTAKEKIGTSFFVRSAIHEYCKQTDLTVLLRDSGELIGLQVLKVIDKVYQSERHPIIFTHYLLESSHPLRQVGEQFRYHVQLYDSFQNPRESPYKTKYLKFYQTDLLFKLDEKVFQLANEWTDGLFEANLQFAFLDLTCGKYFLLKQIFYKTSKKDIQNGLQVLDARLQQKQPCLSQIPNFGTTKNNDKKHPIIIPAKDVRFLDVNEIQNLTQNQINRLKVKFRQMLNQRARLYSKIYIHDKKTVNLTAINQTSITTAKDINLEEVIEVAQLMHVGARPQLYMQQLKEQLANQKPSKMDNKSNEIGKKIISNDPPPLSQAKQSPFSTQQTQFCVFLLTRNNYDTLSFLYTIQSIITQFYSKFKLIILDNKSTDRTAQIIKYHLSIIPQAEKRLITFKQLSKGLRRSQLMSHAIQTYASAKDVIVVMESGFELIGNFVFKYLNQKYKVSQAPAVYTSSVYLQNDIINVGPSQVLPLNIISQKSFRNQPLYYNHLRTFRSTLFSKINQQDFRDENGEWINVGQDQVLSYAIEQLSCGNIAYLNKLLVRLHRKPQTRLLNSSLGQKYECLQTNQLKATP